MYAIIKSHSWAGFGDDEKHCDWYPVYWNDQGEDYFPDIYSSDWFYTLSRMNETLKWLNWNLGQLNACERFKEFRKMGWFENPEKHR
tara:strand:+ start:856 stop:1116 length:261 start_codon:yes stop_codon:yes gene_type:complete